jgi:uncharacterized membrane protein YkoI
MLSFGIKEAQRAEEFAKTNEQKETVLAVVRMMNIPITVQRQVGKKFKKLEAKICNSIVAVTKLKSKAAKAEAKLKSKEDKAEAKVSKQVEEKKAIAETSVNWSF